MADYPDSTALPAAETGNRQFLQAYAAWSAARHRFAVLNATPDDVPEDAFDQAVAEATDELNHAVQSVADSSATGQAGLRKKLEVLEGVLESGCAEDAQRFALQLAVSFRKDLCRHTCQVFKWA